MTAVMGNVEKIRAIARSLAKHEIGAAFDAIRDRDSDLARQAVGTFAVGDRVRFKDRRGQPVAGEVIKADGVGMRWRVSPGLLRKEA